MIRAVRLGPLSLLWISAALAAENPKGPEPPTPGFAIRLEPGHPWRPPFGLDRVGNGLRVIATAGDRPGPGAYALAFFDGKNELRREPIDWPEQPPFQVVRPAGQSADAVALVRSSDSGDRSIELVRARIDRPEIEAEAMAAAVPRLNPVDLGTILVPHGWLLLGPGQHGALEMAAVARRDCADAMARAWFSSAPADVAQRPFPLIGSRIERVGLRLPTPAADGERDVLQVVIADGKGKELWSKSIPVMRVSRPPVWPRFGATLAKLRYDAPISVRDPATGAFSSLPYQRGWRPELHDVVVSLPGGSRFVFWRGSSYIPFWATDQNTGACYEWAEMLSRPENAVDCVEPLMDKELRYGRVEILESTSACLRVRWSYQSTDLHYQVWGDAADEEYTFYPDGFGVRALSLKASPGARYELSEFIVLSPQGAYPLEFLPGTLVEAIGADGRKAVFRFPFASGTGNDPRNGLAVPAIYRLRPHREATRTAVCFTPQETRPPPVVFGAFQDRGEVVTPCYWGSHWPLARGNATGSAIDPRIAVSPCHNSVMSWADATPTPLLSARFPGIDALGRSRPLELRRWVWLIGLTDAADARLIQWAQSFTTPPSLELKGAALPLESYAPERRALRLRVLERSIWIRLDPQPVCVNPVFELTGAPPGPLTVALDGQRLEPDRFAWDGVRLWIDATLEKPVGLALDFANAPLPPPALPVSPSP